MIEVEGRQAPQQQSSLRTGTPKRVWTFILVAKLLTLAWIAGFALAYPAVFRHDAYVQVYRGNYGHPPAAPPAADIVFRTWDAEHYLALAEHGYAEVGVAPRNAFYPLYPWLVRALGWITGGHFLTAALLLSFGFGVVALGLLHPWIRTRFGSAVADTSVLLMCVQPAAFYTVLPYSEALFLLLAVLLLRALSRQQWLAAGALGALLCLTRPVGVLAIGAIVVHAVRTPLRPRALIACALPLVGWAAYFALLAARTGNALLGMELQRHFAAAPEAARLLDPVGFVQSLLAVRSVHGVLGSALDRLMFLWVCLATLSLTLRRKPRPERDLEAFGLGVGLVPAVTNAFMCFTRYASVALAFQVQTAVWLQRDALRRWKLPLAIGLAALQLWLLSLHVRHLWAG